MDLPIQNRRHGLILIKKKIILINEKSTQHVMDFAMQADLRVNEGEKKNIELEYLADVHLGDL